MTIALCCDEERRNAVRAHPTLNGIDFIEVDDDPSQPPDQRQRRLFVHLFKNAPTGANALTTANLRLDGGEVVRDIQVTALARAGRVLTVTVSAPGDFSTYTLRLVASATGSASPTSFDPLLSAIDFSFKANCPTEFDCQEVVACPPQPFSEPTLDYLARDFTSIRQLMLDRLRTLAPGWREDNVADLIHALVDLKAYVADYQHYQLDAVNTEAYLHTARSRVSVRRHARLVDYQMHDGCNARVWVQLVVNPAVGAAAVTVPRQTQLLTRIPGLPTKLAAGTDVYRQALAQRPVVFETMHDKTCFFAHNRLYFYTWGDNRCVLPHGATRATLRDHLLLHPGDVLVLQEVRGAVSGEHTDADPRRCYAVRLVEVWQTTDPLTTTAVTEVRWHQDDALPAPLCLSAAVTPDADAQLGNGISVALGNIVLADHGRTLPVEALPPIQLSGLTYAQQQQHCTSSGDQTVPPRYRPRLREGPVTQAQEYVATDLPVDPGDPPALRSATAIARTTPADALPVITLDSVLATATTPWSPARDLLQGDDDTPQFVVEVEDDGSARLRFGDDVNGKRPNVDENFSARYRVGNGTSGNIGAAALAHIVSTDTDIYGVSNPLPAVGGTDPEPIASVRANAPYAFRTQERAVTPADYEAVARRYPGVQRAAATFRWTGSWYTVFLTIDRVGGLPLDADFERRLRRFLDRFRLAGYDLEVDAPELVALEIDLEVCVAPTNYRSAVRQALLQRLGTRLLPDGTKGLFHPDNLTFGQTVYLSHLYAAVSAVAGVQSATVSRFQRHGLPQTSGLASGQIALGRLEIAQLANDPNFPHRGLLRLTLRGGQ